MTESKKQWRIALEQAKQIIPLLPPAEVGKAVNDKMGAIFSADIPQLKQDLSTQSLNFHVDHIGGAWPQIKP